MGVTLRRASAVAVCIAAVLAAAACGPRETRAQAVTRIRRQFRIVPNGYQVRKATDGSPEVTVSVLVVNESRERLDHLTLRVHVQGTDGHDRTSGLAVVDTSELVPGVTSQLTAIARGLDAGPGEAVLVELEDEPIAGEISGYAEYGDPPQDAR